MKLSFRQVHLDFHTSECIEGIGSSFSKEQFQENLRQGHLSSITVFSKCHHGWAYHPSKANETHPHLDFDLLGAEIEAAHEIGVKTPVYISAGLDEKMAVRHTEWQVRDREGRTTWVPGPLDAGYHMLCFNTPYLDYLLAQIKEVVENYDADGIFLDIVGVRDCHCQACVAEMRRRGWDPRDEEAVHRLGEEVYANYTRRVRETIDSVKPGLPVFHNGGHICRGRRDLAHMNTHLELESLPTGGWGYDHFPLSASYCRTLGMEMLGMTGKFHTSWGEFGGFKHKNALRYEAALSVANGAKCSVGDQLHPNGAMNDATYKLIGAAYKEVEEKEPWLDDVTAVTDVAVLSDEAVRNSQKRPQEDRNNKPDIGAARVLLEGKYLFNVIDMEEDFEKYKVLILPDSIAIDNELESRLKAFLAKGGKLLASGESGLKADGSGFAFDFGCEYVGKSEYKPAYVVPKVPLRSLDPSSYVIYQEGEVVKAQGGEELALREASYVNRDYLHFCSHQHAPNSGKMEGSAAVKGKDGIYFSWKVFSEYAEVGSLILKELVVYALDTLLDGKKTLSTSLPAQGVVTLMEQKEKNRLVSHFLYASPVKRGGGIEIIEDILPVYHTTAEIRCEEPVKEVYLAPQKESVPFTQENGLVKFEIEKFENHQMVVLQK